MVLNNLIFLVCLAVCLLPHFLTEIRLSLDISSCFSILSIYFNLDSAGLSLATWEFLVFSGVNFETSGLVDIYERSGPA